ncbi:hypothetical protein Y032_0029g1907 [Ancylostoma ceylanicum]|uniref:Uncharacterized protein n=1 Tax=Ancylostoma ceylanicum TaxID=53326 RepID=A0A016USP2_9BILA|nr:hypothetical protein Y032_0029g1907 [Ancylostoma ceylanicum]
MCGSEISNPMKRKTENGSAKWPENGKRETEYGKFLKVYEVPSIVVSDRCQTCIYRSSMFFFFRPHVCYL